MNANLFIKYKGIDNKDSSEIDLVTLGESIIGFDVAIKEVFKISKINANLKISINKTREGSLIVDIVGAVVDVVNNTPFKNVNDLLDFLKVTDASLWNNANEFFSGTASYIHQSHRTANDYFARNPLDLEVLSTLVTFFIGYIFGKAGTQKKFPNLNELPKQYAISTHKMIKNHKFKKALKPFVDEKVTSIEISTDKDFKRKTLISAENFENYLSEDEKILPDYENGKMYLFTGKIVAMQCSKGDSLKLQVHSFSRKERDLVAYPPEGKTTKELEKFYEEDVSVKAIIERKSFYQKPKLHIQEITLYNQPLL